MSAVQIPSRHHSPYHDDQNQTPRVLEMVRLDFAGYFYVRFDIDHSVDYQYQNQEPYAYPSLLPKLRQEMAAVIRIAIYGLILHINHRERYIRKIIR